MVVRELLTSLGYKVDESGLKKAENGLQNFANSAVKIGAVAGTAVAVAIGAIGANAIKSASEMESLQGEFAVMLSSAEKAQTLIEKIQKMASTTPFGTTDLVRATKLLLNFGVAEEEVLGVTRLLGDVAGTDKEKMQGLALAFGQITAKTKLMGDDLRQLIERGFNPLQEISRTTGESYASLQKKMSKGLISSDMVKNAFKSATSEGGKFFNNMETQSKLTIGRWSTLKDTIELNMIALGTKLLPVVNQLISAMQKVAESPMISSFVTILEPSINAIAKAITFVTDGFGAMGSSGSIFGNMLIALMPFTEVLMNIGRILKDTLVPIFEKLSPLIIGLMGRVIPLFQNLWSIIGTAVQSLLPKIGIAISSWYSFALEFYGVFVGILEEIMPQLSETFFHLVEVLGIAIDFIVNLFNFLKPVLIFILSFAGDIISLLLKGVLWIVDILLYIPEAFITALDGVLFFLREVLSAFGKAGKVFAKIFGFDDGVIEKALQSVDAGIIEMQAKIKRDEKGSIQKEQHRLGEKNQTTTNIVNNTNMNVNVPEGTDKTQAKRTGRAVRETMESIFSLKLQSIIQTTA